MGAGAEAGKTWTEFWKSGTDVRSELTLRVTGFFSKIAYSTCKDIWSGFRKYDVIKYQLFLVHF